MNRCHGDMVFWWFGTCYILSPIPNGNPTPNPTPTATLPYIADMKSPDSVLPLHRQAKVGNCTGVTVLFDLYTSELHDLLDSQNQLECISLPVRSYR